MADPDLTLRILSDLRDEFRAFRTWTAEQFARVDERFDRVEHRIDNTNMHLVGMDARLTTEISALRGTFYTVGPKQADLEERIARCEREIADLRRRG